MMITVLLFGSIAAVILITRRDRIMQSIYKFEQKYRIREDLYLAPTVIYAAIRHAYQCFISKKVSLWYPFEQSCFTNKNKIALNFIRPIKGKSLAIDGDDSFELQSYTYTELYEIILRLSYILVNDYGICKNDIIAMDFSNKPLFIFLWFSLWNIGAIPSFINYNLTQNPLLHSLKVVNAKQVFVDDEISKNFKSTLKSIELELPNLSINFINENDFLLKLTDLKTPKLRIDDKIRDENTLYYDPAVLVYTSGTTGLPKAAVNSWRKTYFASYFFPHAIRLTSNSNIYTAMPLYHGTASILGVLPALIQGATLSLGTKFSLSSYWTQVKLTKANTIQYVGEVCRYLVGASDELRDEKSIKGQVHAAYGNGLRKDIWMKFKERYGIETIGEFYASSESPFAMTCYERDGTVGVGAIRNQGWLADKALSLEYIIVKTEDEDDMAIYRDSKTGFGRKAKSGEKGELLMKVMNPKNIKATFPGYLNNEQATYSKVIKDVFKKGDVYIRTDDLLSYDQYGCIHFVDRLGDTYRWKSENVSTTEVENEIMSIENEISNCVVVGAKIPNHEGRCGYAIIELIDETIDRNELLKQLAKNVFARLPHFARPCFIRFEKIDLGHTHKISKKVFRDPILPHGKSGKDTVYWLDTSDKTYKLLDEPTYSKICQGVIRL
ncbi:hypothetical protein CANARDRAFT_27766 [[Candida] arabinofermentans NRRL YB-2248]|uniref:Very long-chain fatty acid transport protein n=1 Tax=[Candida] arabinofermentans NRRL YB-2248 TaxID=983967 RepID=A0A1E4T1R4_9ASCO|nr:hypothetical protein CANARDRAFT_27766 [[Candida] arabinofermentans NRRL YB-2248]